jgi:hemerythrin-like domain-containing protein
MASKAGTKPGVDAIKLLTDEHKQVKALFTQYEKLADKEMSDEPAKQALALEICTALTIHIQIEEEILYPVGRGLLEEEGLMDEADVEHASAKELIAQIQAMGPGESHYDAKVLVLGEYIDHHVKEEHAEMFPKLKKAGLDTLSVGAALAARRAKLQEELELAEEHVAAGPAAMRSTSRGRRPATRRLAS